MSRHPSLYRGDSMASKDLLKNDDSVSISIGFILMFAITVLMFTTIVLSFYTLTQNTEKSAMRVNFKLMGHGLAGKITMADTLINTTRSYGGTVNSFEYEFSIPASIAGKTFTVNITNSTHEIIMESDNGAREVVPFNASSNFTEIKLYSGAENYKLKYDASSNSLYVAEK